MVDLADIECQAPQGCLAYAVYFRREPSEYVAISGEHSDLVSQVVESDKDGLEVAWAFSEELCAQDVCSYCLLWSGPGVCPGVFAHAKHALVRNQYKFPWYDMEIGVFLVPFDLTIGEVFAEVLRQIRAGVTYAVAS